VTGLDIQEALLFLPPVERGRDLIPLRQLQPLAVILDWREQRSRWRTLHAGLQPGLPG
jgi:hypothetical protein